MKNFIDTELISNYIAHNHLTKAEFCKQSGLSIGTLNNILKGNDFKASSLRKLARALNISADKILEK